MKLREIIYLEKELIKKLENFVDYKKQNFIFNPSTNQLFSKSYLISQLIKTFFNSGLSLKDFCKKFKSLKEQINGEQ